ncbi:MAG: helix-turn-helix domain-containing protein [Lachnospiraceae bacterium]|nr:helix-turn-helix domain-containing protein [Lachnospiraceae bacterium]
MELSERLQQLRKKENYSQEQLAELLGISRQAVSKWESGQGYPDISNIMKLAEIYNVSTDYILLEKKEETQSDTAPKSRIISKKAIDIIAIIAATALITVLFIAALGFVNKIL